MSWAIALRPRQHRDLHSRSNSRRSTPSATAASSRSGRRQGPRPYNAPNHWDTARSTWGRAEDQSARAAGAARTATPLEKLLSQQEHTQALKALRTCTCTVVLTWPDNDHLMGQAVVIDGAAPDLQRSTWARLITNVGLSASNRASSHTAWIVKITPDGLHVTAISASRARALIRETKRP